MTAAPQDLVLGGAVGAMALVSLLMLSARRRDFVALSLGALLASLSASLLLGHASPAGQWCAFLALPCLVGFVAALLLRERHTAWPWVSGLMVLAYAALLFDLVEGASLAATGLIAFVAAPGLILRARATLALDAAARLAQDQAKFTADMLDLAPVALSMRDPDGRYQYANKTWEAYFGVRRDGVIGTSPRDRATQEVADNLLSMDQAAMQLEPGVTMAPTDFQLRGRNYMQTRTPLADSRGKLLGVLIASTDTTERTTLEKALDKEQVRFELLVRASKAGILDWAGVTRTVYYSPRFKEILQFAADTDTTNWPDYFEMVHPDDRLRVQARFREHVSGATRRPGALDVHELIEYRLRCSDGSFVWIEAFGSSIRDQRGFALRFIASITDISQRIAAEEALRSSEEHYRQVVNNVGEGMIVIQDGKFIFANPALFQLLAYREEEILGREFLPFVYPEDRDLIQNNYMRRLQGEPAPPRTDFRVLHKSGKPMWVQISTTMVDWNGQPATLTFMSDISERKQAEDDTRSALATQQELNDVRNRFVAMTSHEFRTPLATILSSTELIKDYGDRLPAHDKADIVQSIEDGVQRMTHMLDRVLLLSKAQARMLEFHPQAIDLAALCQALITEVAARYPESACQLDLSIAGDATSGILDAKLLTHIIGNLLSNAIKYSPAGGTVRFDVARVGQTTVFSVADQGIGIPGDELAHLFGSFHRASNVGAIAGTGLGLAIIKEAVDLHGGGITVQSQPGEGTVFTVTLPSGPQD